MKTSAESDPGLRHARRVLRLVAVSAAIAFAAGGCEAWRLLAGRGQPSSPLLWASPGLAFCGAIVAALVALAPRGVLDRLCRWWLDRCSPVSALAPKVVALLFLMSLILWAFNIRSHLQNPTPPERDDQGAFLALADEIQAIGGLPQLWSQMHSGDYEEANRHPLYPYLLSQRPSMAFGRALSCVIGLVALVSGTWLVGRRFSWAAAGVFAVLLATNRSFAGYSTSVVCESLMILLGGLSYFVLLPASKACSGGFLRALAAAALLGFLYLTKATGLLFFGVFVWWLIWVARPRRAEEIETAGDAFLPADRPYQFRRLVIVVTGSIFLFLVVVHPLVERNVRRFGNPFYNVNSLLLFADEYGQFESMVLKRTTTGQAAKAYFETHGTWQIVEREVAGLAWEAFLMLRSLGPVGLDDARVLFGVPLAVLSLLSLMADRRPATGLLIAWVLASWVVFAWYVPIAAGDRFAIPLLMPVLAHAADGAVRLFARRGPRGPVISEWPSISSS